MPYLIGLLLFASVSLAAAELLRPRARSRIATRAQGDDAARASDRTAGSPTARFVRPFVARWGRRISRVLPQNLVAAVDRMLVMADQPWSLAGFLFVWAASGLTSIVLFYYVGVQSVGLTLLQAVIMGAVLVPMGFVTPYAYLRHRVNRRHKAIIRAMPDAMDLLVTCMEAGLSIDAAFAMVAEKTTGPLADAITSYLRAVGFGRSRREALQEVAMRTGVAELMGIAHAVNQSEQLGSTVGDVLRVYADDLRVQRRQRAEAAAQRAPVLMTLPLVTCFLPAIGAVVLVPSVLNLLRFVGGNGGLLGGP